MSSPRVIGLDLSLTSTGIAHVDGTTSRIKTRPADGDHRLVIIRETIRATLRRERPVLAVVEDLPFTANSAGVTGMVHGVVRAELAAAHVPRALIAPASLKMYACDHGRAGKPQMAAAAHLAAGVEFADDPGGDQCDAWWLRAAGLDRLGAPLVEMPAAQRARLDKARWPNLSALAVAA